MHTHTHAYIHMHTQKTVVMRLLDVECPVRQTDRQGDQRDIQTEKRGNQTTESDSDSVSGLLCLFFVVVVAFQPSLQAVPPLKCACSCKQIFRSSNSANNCNEAAQSDATRQQSRGIIIEFAYESISLPIHTHTRPHTHACLARMPAVAVVWQRHTNYGN